MELAQVAAHIGDDMLLGEGAIRLQTCAAPLLASKAEYPMLWKALAACHLTLADIKSYPAVTIQVQDSSFLSMVPWVHTVMQAATSLASCALGHSRSMCYELMRLWKGY